MSGRIISGVSVLLFSCYFLVEAHLPLRAIEHETTDMATCQGHHVDVPKEYIRKGLVAAAECIEFLDDGCFAICTIYHFDGGRAVHRNGSLNMNYVRQESEKIQLPKEIAPLKETMMAAVEECARGRTFKRPGLLEEECDEADIFAQCMIKKYVEICGHNPAVEKYEWKNGKKPSANMGLLGEVV